LASSALFSRLGKASSGVAMFNARVPATIWPALNAFDCVLVTSAVSVFVVLPESLALIGPE